MRERLSPPMVEEPLTGITPACAGKTLRRTAGPDQRRDHPRMCGKDPTPCRKMHGTLGSPPHVRERHEGTAERLCEFRITPACAGKTNGGFVSVDQDKDHPRMCGKDVTNYHWFKKSSGSPPHVRERRNITLL